MDDNARNDANVVPAAKQLSRRNFFQLSGGLAAAGEDVLHGFLEAGAAVLRQRLNARVTAAGKDWAQVAREAGLTGVDEIVTAASRQPGGTLRLRSDRLDPAELADRVLTAVSLNRSQPR